MIAELIPWLIGIGGIVLMVLLCVGGALYMRGSLSERERRELEMPLPDEHRMTAVRCAWCGKPHTRRSLYCSPDHEYMFHLERNSPDLFAGAQPSTLNPQSSTIECDCTHHQILPKKQIPRVAVPAPVLRHGKIVR